MDEWPGTAGSSRLLVTTRPQRSERRTIGAMSHPPARCRPTIRPGNRQGRTRFLDQNERRRSQARPPPATRPPKARSRMMRTPATLLQLDATSLSRHRRRHRSRTLPLDQRKCQRMTVPVLPQLLSRMHQTKGPPTIHRQVAAQGLLHLHLHLLGDSPDDGVDRTLQPHRRRRILRTSPRASAGSLRRS